MKKISITTLLLFLLLCGRLLSQSIDYPKALAKTYGVVRYFQPTSESQKLDWESFAIYSSYEISKAKTKQELIIALQKVFYPVSSYIIIDANPTTPLPTYQQKEFSYYKHTGAGLDAYIPKNVPKEYKPYFTEIITKSIDSLDKNLSQTIHQEIAEGVFLHYSVCIPYSKGLRKDFKGFHKQVKSFHKQEFKKVATVKLLMRNRADGSFLPSFYQIGYIIQLWNATYYFNPYLDKKYWETLLEKYLKTALVGKSFLNHYVNLQIMASDMNDSHALAISGMLTTNPLVAVGISKYSPLVETKLIEGKIMANISEDKLVKKGDVIKTINGKTTDELINQKLLYAIGASHKAKMNNVGSTILEELNKKGSKTADTLTIGRYNQTDTTVVLKTQGNVFLMKPKKEQPFNRNLGNNICYIDVCDRRFSMEKAKEFIIANKDAKGFIFDVRGYPNIPSDELLGFFSTKSLEGLEMVTPVIISPIIANDTTSNIEINKYKIENIQSKAKVVCLSSADTYSYPETWLGTVKKNKIGTIIGEATAGTNGDVVMVKNTKIFGLWFTGLIVKMNGKRTHGIGILPDIEVSPTIEGIREGKDEVLERAIKYLNTNK